MEINSLCKWEKKLEGSSLYLIKLIQRVIEFEEYIKVEQYLFTPKNEFMVTRKRKFLNIEKIHPIQQENVEKILDELKKYDCVSKVIIFGSSVTPRCTYYSDLDIYVELDKEVNVKTFNIDTPVDFWTNFSVEKPMLEEIKNKGVVVYESQ